MNMTTLHQYYNFALEIAEEAGKILLQHQEENFKISYKGEKNNPVTEIDTLTEQYLISAIESRYKNHHILTEESGDLGTQSTFRWIIDPLDGTVNYAHRHPFFAVSLALEIEGDIAVGVVYAPKIDEFFHAAKNEGAFLNKKKIQVSAVSDLNIALLGTGFSYEERKKNLPFFEKFLVQSQAIRRCGSAAIDLAYVAAGRYDGFWEFNLCPWDIAAGKLLIEEAGGRITSMDGSKLDLNGKNLLASNGFLHKKMIEII